MPSDCHSACACDCGVRTITPKEIQKKFDKLEAEIKKLRDENQKLCKDLKKYEGVAEILDEVERRKKRPRKVC